MSDEGQVVQVWVRTEKAQVFGPLTPTSVELLLDNGVITGRVQVSLDGVNYVFPGRMPGIRMVFPKTLWGEQVLPPNELDEVWSKAVAPPPLPSSAPAHPPAGAVPGGPVPRAGPGAPVAGPGAAPRAGPGAPVAGPGARAQAQTRPMNPAQASAQQRPPQAAPRPPVAPGRPATLGESLFGDDAPGPPVSSPSGLRPAPPPARPMTSSASIAAAMGPAPQAAPSSSPSQPAISSPSPVPAPSSPSTVAVAPLQQIPAQGDLRELSGQRLYFLAASQDLSGLLTVQLAERALSIHFRKGSPDAVDSTHPEDALHSFLIRAKLVGMEQLAQAQKEGARFGGELLPALFGLGLLNPNVAIEALTQRVHGLILQVLLAREGTFTFQPVELPPHRAMPPGNRWQVYTEQLRKVPGIEQRSRLHDALDFPVMKASGQVPVSELRLSAQESRVYAAFNGTQTLNHFLQGPEGELALRVAFMLAPCDLVSFAGTVVKTAPRQPPPRPVAPPPAAPVMAEAAPPPSTVPGPPPGVVPGNPVPPRMPNYPGAQPPGAPPPRAPVPPPAAAPPPRPVLTPQGPAPARPVITPAGPPPAAPPRPVITSAGPAPAVASRPSGVAAAPAMNFEVEIKRLQDLFAKMKTQNHFEVLGLTKDSPASAVKVAYFRAAKDYHPDTVPPGAPEALAKAKADIFGRVGDAQRTLMDDALRKDYLDELAAGGAGEKVDVSKILQAEEFFQKGKILVQARKFVEAVKVFDDCVLLTPDDAEVYTWRGYAKFFTFPDKKVGFPEAMKDITVCLKKNPNIVAAHFHQGMMAKILGDLPAAKKHFQQTVKLDPKHIDAQRELRMMK